SAYGDIPITTLHQKRRYSIEHVVPRGFLSEYLRRNGAATGIQRGSTVNPLNFVAAERAANAQRNSFPFDWDGDSIRRPRRLTLDPQVYVTVGFDHENQWVVPSRSRGDLARAILYMTIVYQVRDLYNSHVDQLRHWAKVDVATPWELDYNRWVAARLGIRNPFIDRPEAALRWLDDDALMASIQSPSPPTSR
ncbi:MAG: endonuclease, partial [Magnetospiraceae bacterium]